MSKQYRGVVAVNADVRRAALEYVAIGLSVLPIRGDGTKKPARKWKPFQTAAPTAADIDEWFADPDPLGLAVVTGAVSGHLEVIDCDAKAVAADFAAALRAAAPGLLELLVVAESPRGRHFYYRSPAAGRNAKLAQEPNPESAGRPRTLIDMKAEGRYVIAPPIGHGELCRHRRADRVQHGRRPVRARPRVYEVRGVRAARIRQ